MLVILFSPDRAPTLLAQSLEPGIERVRLPVEASASGSLEALLYEESLAELGLGAGTIEVVPAKEGRKLPEPREVFKLELGSSSREWRPVGWVDVEAAALSIADGRPACELCGDCGQVTGLPARTADLENWAIRIAPDRWMFELWSREEAPLEFLEIGPLPACLSSPVEGACFSWVPRPQGLDPPWAAFSASYQDPDGTLWLAGFAGELWRADHPGHAFAVERAGTSSSTQKIHLLTGGANREGLPELFAFGRKCVLTRFTPALGRSTDLPVEDLFPERPEECDAAGELIWLGPGRVVLVPTDRSDVLDVRWLEGDAVRIQRTRVADGIRLRTGALVPGTGLVLGDDRGDVYAGALSPPWGWRRLGNIGGSTDSVSKILAVLPYRDGFVVLARDARLIAFYVEYRPGRGFCAQGHLDIMSWTRIAELSDGTLLLTGARPPDGAPEPPYLGRVFPSGFEALP